MSYPQLLRRLFTPSDLPEAGRAQALRERILTALLYSAATLGTVALIVSIGRVVRQAQWVLAATYTLAYLWLLAIALIRRLPYWVRAASLLVIVFALGPVRLVDSGLSGDGRVFLLAFPVLSALLLGMWGGLGGLGLSLAALAIIGWLMTSGRLPLPPLEAMANSGSPSDWISGTAIFMVLGTLATLPLALVVRGLDIALGEQKQLLEELQDERIKLERLVSERTSDLNRETTQLQTTAEIARLAGVVRDPKEVAARAVELIRTRFNFYHASVFALDETGTWAELVAGTGEVGRELKAKHHRLAVGSASIIGWVTANRSTRVASDAEKDPFYFRNPLLPATRSEMAVPLMIGQRLVGALDVQSTHPHAFGEADVSAIEAIAAGLAIAYENARLLGEARKGTVRFGSEVQARWASSWARLAGSGVPPVMRFGGATDTGDGTQVAREIADQAASSGKTVVDPDTREAATPIIVRGEIVATIAARKTKGIEGWTEDDIAVLEAVAGQAALALDGARQFSEEQRRLAELEVVNRIGQAATQLSNFDSLYRVVHTQISHVLGEADMSLSLYDEETGQISFPYVSERGEVSRLEPTPLGEGLLPLVIRSRQPLLLVEDVERQAAELGAKVIGRVAKSWLGVPMIVGDKTIGAIVIQDMDREGRYSEDDAALLGTVANQVAAALQNAQLIEQVRRAARRQSLIHEITTKLRRSPDMDTILTTAARELGLGLNATKVVARLGERPRTFPEGRIRFEKHETSQENGQAPSEREEGQ